METKNDNFICAYCHKTYCNQYKLERHQKETQLCIKIQQLQPLDTSIFPTIIQQHFDPEKTSKTYIADFILQHVINKNNYIVSDKTRYIGKYIDIAGEVQHDDGLKLIFKLYQMIIATIPPTEYIFYTNKGKKSQVSKSKMCKLPAKIKNAIVKEIYYKK